MSNQDQKKTVAVNRELLFAIWANFAYPYILGGEVTHIDECGNVETVEYGPGFRFKPIALLPIKVGRDFMKQAKELEDKRKKELQALEKNHMNHLKNISNSLPSLKGYFEGLNKK